MCIRDSLFVAVIHPDSELVALRHPCLGLMERSVFVIVEVQAGNVVDPIPIRVFIHPQDLPQAQGERLHLPRGKQILVFVPVSRRLFLFPNAHERYPLFCTPRGYCVSFSSTMNSESSSADMIHSSSSASLSDIKLTSPYKSAFFSSSIQRALSRR